MTNYHLTPSATLPSFAIQEVAESKAARKKVIEQAQQLERDSYKAFMRRKRQLQATSDLATIA